MESKNKAELETGEPVRIADSHANSILGRHPEGDRQDRLPVVILGVVIAVFLIISVRLLFMFFSASAEHESVTKTSAERLGPVTKQVKNGEEENSILKGDDINLGNRKAEKVREESTALALSENYAGQEETDLIAFYPFNGNAHDESGRGNHGTVHGATLTEDRFGNENSAYSFDGVDDYIDIGRPLVFGDFTISFWFKSNGRQNKFAVPISQGNMAYRGFNFTFTKGLYNGFNWGTLDEKKVPNPQWGKSVWHTLNFNFQKDIDFDLTWHHLVATQKGDVITIYRDGEFQAKALNFPINYGRFNFNIGRSSGNKDFNHRAFKGAIDDIRIYSRAITNEEIRICYVDGG